MTRISNRRLAQILVIANGLFMFVISVPLNTPGLLLPFFIAPLWLTLKWRKTSQQELLVSGSLLLAHRLCWCLIILLIMHNRQPDPQDGILGLGIFAIFLFVDVLILCGGLFVGFAFSLLSANRMRESKEANPNVSPDQLAVIARDMNLMTIKPDAVVSYELLSDSLQWSDELPPLGNHLPRDFWCLRPLFRYRTTLILDQPDENSAAYWDEGKKLFPQWAGFHPMRCTPNRELAEVFERQSSIAMESLEEDFKDGES